MTDLEQELRELAHYHGGLFSGAASRLDPDPAAIAHALFLLIEVAEERRQEWLASAKGENRDI